MEKLTANTNIRYLIIERETIRKKQGQGYCNSEAEYLRRIQRIKEIDSEILEAAKNE